MARSNCFVIFGVICFRPPMISIKWRRILNNLFCRQSRVWKQFFPKVRCHSCAMAQGLLFTIHFFLKSCVSFKLLSFYNHGYIMKDHNLLLADLGIYYLRYIFVCWLLFWCYCPQEVSPYLSQRRFNTKEFKCLFISNFIPAIFKVQTRSILF